MRCVISSSATRPRCWRSWKSHPITAGFPVNMAKRLPQPYSFGEVLTSATTGDPGSSASIHRMAARSSASGIATSLSLYTARSMNAIPSSVRPAETSKRSRTLAGVASAG